MTNSQEAAKDAEGELLKMNVNDECGLYTTNVVIMDVMLWKYEKNTWIINEKFGTKKFTIKV